MPSQCARGALRVRFPEARAALDVGKQVGDGTGFGHFGFALSFADVKAVIRRRAFPSWPSYNAGVFESGTSMEAERLNQIEGTVADLRGRLAELRRYL